MTIYTRITYEAYQIEYIKQNAKQPNCIHTDTEKYMRHEMRPEHSMT